MIKLENTEVLGWEAAIRGMRNPMNSWEKSDSKDELNFDTGNWETKVGPNDHKLMMNLAKAGSVDAKYRRMIVVTVDITAPLYWWKEFDTYKVGTVANSCSTMHKIHAKEFTLDDFSHEHLLECDILDENENAETECWIYPFTNCIDGDGEMEEYPLDILNVTIKMLNKARDLFLDAKENAKRQKDESDRAKRVGQVPASSGRYFEMMAKKYWWQMIQLLPTSYNQRRTVMLNYEVLAGIYPKRKDHKLDEWHTFCDWIKSLPYSEIITMEETNEQN